MIESSSVFTLVASIIISNCINIPSLVIGAYYHERGTAECVSENVPTFSLMTWLLISGACGVLTSIFGLFMDMLMERRAQKSTPEEVRQGKVWTCLTVYKLVVVFFMAAWWCVGVAIMTGLSDSCKSNFRRVWDMAIADLFFTGLAIYVVTCVVLLATHESRKRKLFYLESERRNAARNENTKIVNSQV